MELQTLIHKQLWEEISNSYESGNYKNAILDAMRYLSKIIRDKSGLDGDGVSLVGQAFGGDEPVLKINKLQTASERDEQKGFQQILMGLYQGIRNPRTHSDKKDNLDSANAIIYFVDFILGALDKAKPPFTLEDFLPRVFDSDFAQREDYADEITRGIPSEKRLETLIQIYRHKIDGDGNKLGYATRKIWGDLSDIEKVQFAAVVSEEFEKESDIRVLVKAFQLLPTEFWGMTNKAATIRIENKIILSLKSGKVDLVKGTVNPEGILGTHACRFVSRMKLQDDIKATLSNKMIKSNNMAEQLYMVRYYYQELETFFSDDWSRPFCIAIMFQVVKLGDSIGLASVSNFLNTCSEKWKTELIKKLGSDRLYYDEQGFLHTKQSAEDVGLPF